MKQKNYQSLRILNKLCILTFFLIFSVNFSTACSCHGGKKIAKAVRNYDVIISAKIISKKEIDIEDKEIFYSEKKIEYQIFVTEVLKGEKINKQLKLITGVGKGDCGFVFNPGDNYIIYAKYSDKYYAMGKQVNPFLETDICSRTKLWDKKEQKKILRNLKRIRINKS